MSDAEKIKKLETEIERLNKRLDTISESTTSNFNEIYNEFDERLKKAEPTKSKIDAELMESLLITSIGRALIDKKTVEKKEIIQALNDMGKEAFPDQDIGSILNSC